ncbi:hypothetical protein MATL_G00228840 [Megalops atlanticus]|uniref:Tapasin n=1 Tax=Megalops atlanticus TaxID=7932 RepID=A0A9D3PEQ0_MEGAT|nr:hypothetical protein MATL_G00228840 [Megalops atlanticus]
MTEIATIYKLSLVAFIYALQVYGTTCPVLECWFVQEKPGRGGGFPAAMSQEKSMLYIRTDPDSTETGSKQNPPNDINPTRVYYVTDPAPLTDSAHSPIYLQADWLSASLQGLDGQLTLSSVMRAPTATNKPSVILSVSSRTVSVRSRLGEPVLLDCGFWTDSSSPLSGSGFSVEWRYQFRGEGRLVLAYDGKSDRLAETAEEGAELNFTALHQTGNASLTLQEAQCEAAGFAPHLLELRWEFAGADGGVRPLGEGRLSGHRQAADGTFTQSSQLELGRGGPDLGRAGRSPAWPCTPGAPAAPP